ncbi:MAG TPA: DUF1254 domain-containing protein [Candidatus Angelobacter sp.]|nr:DUF1254 domain-containing protein [Candidatus Angelobacter sp.]
MTEPKERRSSSSVSAQQARDIAIEAYVFGYPLVLVDLTRQVLTNVSKPGENAAPVNQFCNKRTFPDPTLTAVVSPNADTLYSVAFLDLAREPMVLSLPEMNGRYYLMQMLDAWTNVFASPGTRTTGSSKADLALTGPGWKGKLHKGVEAIKSPTGTVWIIGRTQTNGKSDYAAVNAIQDQYKLTPLSSFGKQYTAPDNVAVSDQVDMKTPPVDQVARLDAAGFFGRLNALMKDNPPAPADAEALKRFALIGVAPGRTLNLRGMDPAVAKQVTEGVAAAQARIIAEVRKPHGDVRNGWEFMGDVGRYGTNYLWRAVVAFVALGANLPEDAVYPRATRDSEGQALNGSRRYEVRFQKGQLPPVSAFWSIALYNDKQFFVPNPIHRYAIGDRDKLEFNDDGSLSIYIQHDSPGKDKESNWLPAPTENFSLFMRLYWPRREVLNGAWKPPKIERKAAEIKRIA